MIKCSSITLHYRAGGKKSASKMKKVDTPDQSCIGVHVHVNTDGFNLRKCTSAEV